MSDNLLYDGEQKKKKIDLLQNAKQSCMTCLKKLLKVFFLGIIIMMVANKHTLNFISKSIPNIFDDGGLSYLGSVVIGFMVIVIYNILLLVF